NIYALFDIGLSVGQRLIDRLDPFFDLLPFHTGPLFDSGPPNGLRLSGERSRAERVRCSRGVGGSFSGTRRLQDESSPTTPPRRSPNFDRVPSARVELKKVARDWREHSITSVLGFGRC